MDGPGKAAFGPSGFGGRLTGPGPGPPGLGVGGLGQPVGKIFVPSMGQAELNAGSRWQIDQSPSDFEKWFSRNHGVDAF